MMLAAKSFDLITTPMLAFTAGGFLYIAAFSLLPTIFREAKSHRLATFPILLGIAIIFILSFVFNV
ncbi:MAG: hypothetical protein V1887_00400, partial [Candidatus Aenigmatarchaeota archaeon]